MNWSDATLNPANLRSRLKQAREIRIQRTQELERKLAAVLGIIEHCDAPGYHWILHAAAQKRPWRPQRAGWVNVLDQLLHAAYGALLLLPVLLLDSYWGAGLMGLLAGGIREVEQYFNQDLKIRMTWDRVVDASAFVVGALVLYHFLR